MSDEHVIGLFSEDGCPSPETSIAERRGDGPATGTTTVDARKGMVGDAPRPAGGVAVDAPSASAGTVAPETKTLAEHEADFDTLIAGYKDRWGKMRERRPDRDRRSWREFPVPFDDRNPYRINHSAWTDGNLTVISSAAIMDMPDGSGVGPTWLLSVSVAGRRRAGDKEVRRTLRAFGMVGAEEDNHSPGVSRAFFLPVDPKARAMCECKANEEVIVEPDGYAWTNPKEARDNPALCRGCEMERTAGKVSGRTCSIHNPDPKEG